MLNDIIMCIGVLIGVMIGGFLFAMWVKGDLQPTRLRKLIRKWRNK